MKKQRQGKGKISAFEISISFSLSHSLICRFQAMPNISFKVYLHGVCGRWGIREREMLKEVRCYGLTICHPTNIFCWNSNSQCNGMRHWSLLKVFQKGWKEHLQSHFMRPRLSWYQNQTRTLQEKKILADIPNKYRCKNPQQNIRKTNSIIHEENTGQPTPVFLPGKSKTEEPS